MRHKTIIPLLVTPSRRDEAAVERDDLHVTVLAEEVDKLLEIHGVPRVPALQLSAERFRIFAALRPTVAVFLTKGI